MMNVASQVNNADEIIKAICDLLEFDFDKIKEFYDGYPRKWIRRRRGAFE